MRLSSRSKHSGSARVAQRGIVKRVDVATVSLELAVSGYFSSTSIRTLSQIVLTCSSARSQAQETLKLEFQDAILYRKFTSDNVWCYLGRMKHHQDHARRQ